MTNKTEHPMSFVHAMFKCNSGLKGIMGRLTERITTPLRHEFQSRLEGWSLDFPASLAVRILGVAGFHHSHPHSGVWRQEAQWASGCLPLLTSMCLRQLFFPAEIVEVWFCGRKPKWVPRDYRDSPRIRVGIISLSSWALLLAALLTAG